MGPFKEFEEECRICPDSILEPAVKEIFPQCADTPLINISAAARAKVRTVLVQAYHKMIKLSQEFICDDDDEFEQIVEDALWLQGMTRSQLCHTPKPHRCSRCEAVARNWIEPWKLRFSETKTRRQTKKNPSSG
jgi:hypothetical protein